jgi:sulfur-oxidizing protein SoxB
LVTNAGSNGKFLAVLDLDLAKGRVNGVRYRLLPVYAGTIAPDPDMERLIERLRAPHAAAFEATLATAHSLLYRRGNFNGTMDQLVCDALRRELDAEIALSPGFRWGTTVLPDEPITMEGVLAQTAITYPQVYVQAMTGAELKDMMEDVADNLFNPDPYYQQGGDMVRLGGMDYSCAPGEAIGRRIADMVLDDGRALEAGKTYRVAGWASLGQPDGQPVWDVFASHLGRRKVAAVDKLNRVRLVGVSGNPGIVD